MPWLRPIANAAWKSSVNIMTWFSKRAILHNLAEFDKFDINTS